MAVDELGGDSCLAGGVAAAEGEWERGVGGKAGTDSYGGFCFEKKK